MERGESSGERKILYGILATLCAAALILGVIIVAKILNNKSQTAETQDATSTETQESDAEYYRNLANEIISQDIDFTRGSEAIENAIKADELSQNTDSAAFVLNVSSTYGMQGIHDQYSKILKERQIEAGVNPEVKGEG
jgi:hypothetical protein